MRPPALLPPLAAACLLLLAAAARADEWAIDRSFGARLSYTDNLNMQQANPISTSSLTVSPSAKFSSRTESHDYSIAFGLNGNRYSSHAEYDAVDHNLSFAGKWNLERDQLGLTASSVRDSTLNNELQATGVVLARRQRTQNQLQENWGHNFDKTLVGGLSAVETRVRYESGPGLVDYDDDTVGASLTKVLSERAMLLASLSADNYRTADGNSRNRSTSVSFGGQWQYSERLSLGANFGRQRTRTDQTFSGWYCINGLNSVCYPLSISPSSDSVTSTYSADAGYQFERGSLALNAGRHVQPSGVGALLETDSAGINYKHTFDETLSGSLSGSVTSSSYPGNESTNTRYSTLSAALTWKLDEWLSVDCGLIQSRQRASGQEQPTRGNSVYVNLTWGFKPLSRSW